MAKTERIIRATPYRGRLATAVALTLAAALLSAPFDAATQNRAPSSIALIRDGRSALAVQDYEAALAAFDRALEIDGQSRDAVIGRSAALLRLDRGAEAVDHLSALIERDPENANARFYRGVALTRLGRFDEAIADLEVAERVGGDFAVLAMRLGDALYAKGDAAGALEAYRRASRGANPRPSVFRGMGNAAYALGDFETAADAYREALQGDPRDGYAALYRGWANEKLGRVDAALADYDLAIETLGGAAPDALIARGDLLRANGANGAAFLDYSTALEIAPKTPAALYGAARALLDQGEIIEAQPYLERLIRNAGDDRALAAKAYLQRGRARFLGGDPRGAERDYTLALEQNPEDAFAYFNRALARARLRDVAGALADYREAARLAPAIATMQYAYGRAAVAAGRPKEALEAAGAAEALLGQDPLAARERARTLLALDRPFAALTVLDDFLDRQPRDGQALELKAMAMTRLGRNTEALAFAEALIDAAPNSPVGHLLEAEAQIALAEPEAAREALERANALGADPATVLRLAGGAWLTEARLKGDAERPQALEQAAAALDAAVDLSEDANQALVLRAAARERMGDLEGARRDLDRVIALRPQDAELRFARASLLKKLGSCTEALKDYDAGLSIRPDNASARAARASCRFEEGRVLGGLADWIGSLL